MRSLQSEAWWDSKRWFQNQNEVLGFPLMSHREFRHDAMFKWKCYFYEAGKYAIWKYPEKGDLVQKNGTSKVQWVKWIVLFLRALCWTGWSSIVNTSFPCLTLLPSNRKTEMRPCREGKKKRKRKKTLNCSRQYLTHPNIHPVQPED